MSAAVALAAVLGLTMGLGLWSLASIIPRLRAPRLIDRVAPYVVDVSAGAREYRSRRTVDPLPVIGGLFAPAIHRAGRGLAQVLGGNEELSIRLAQAKLTQGADRFRAEQFLVAVGAGLLSLAGAVVLTGTGRSSVVMIIALPLVGAMCGVVIHDLIVRTKAKRRIRRLESELPTVLEFLTLSLSAGESVGDALRRVARVSTGDLAVELRSVMVEVNTGVPLSTALRARASELRIGAFTRFVDQTTGAIERGTPLAEVLRAQAKDSRELKKRALLEVAGKKEVGMLVPLVFLILPITVLFAVFPGVVVLQNGF